MDLKSLLVGVDFEGSSGGPTPGSLTAARQACWLAERVGARVQFLHATYRNAEDDAPPEPAEIDRAALDEVVRGYGAQEAELILSEEPPWIALTKRVLDGQNDMVVAAKRNHVKSDDRRLGSTSMKLVRKCPCPVWVVKPDHPDRHASILVGTDLSAVGDRAVEYGAFLASVEECQLFVVHAWQMSMELQLSAARISEEELRQRTDQIVEGARTHIRAITAAHPEVDAGVRILVARDKPSRAILEAVQHEDPDLVVLGTISRGGLAGMLVGNTAEKLIYELDCSLLTIKPADFVCPLEPSA